MVMDCVEIPPRGHGDAFRSRKVVQRGGDRRLCVSARGLGREVPALAGGREPPSDLFTGCASAALDLLSARTNLLRIILPHLDLLLPLAAPKPPLALWRRRRAQRPGLSRETIDRPVAHR